MTRRQVLNIISIGRFLFNKFFESFPHTKKISLDGKRSNLICLSKKGFLAALYVLSH